MNLENIELSAQTKKNLLAIGYDKLTSIQEKIIPVVLSGKDIVGQSPTGTGKTASFIIPTLEKLTRSFYPQVLVLVPTRELALQVSEEAKKLSAGGNLRVLAVYGGVPIPRQLDFFRRGVEMVVGTPGRIIDHLNRKSFRTQDLKFVILDEVDEMIGRGFLEDIEKIITQTPRSRQTLLFSATITPQVKFFSDEHLKNPEYIISGDLNPQINNISQYFIETSSKEKPRVLINWLRTKQPEATLIFASTKRRVERLKEILTAEGLKADYIHSDLSQSRRFRVLSKFRQKQIPLLVATDVAARGIDIKDISHIINYDLPQNTEFYIHRIGRTGRSGKTGQAISFVSSWKEKEQLKRIGQEKKYKIDRLTI